MLEDDRNYDAVNVIRPPLFTNASGDFLLLDRDSYHRLRGFNEVYRVAKIHIDGNFCLKAFASQVPLLDIGHPSITSDAEPSMLRQGRYRNRPGDAPWGDRRWKSDVIYLNGPEWGLRSHQSGLISASVTAIDFDWNAVGPMVDLRRVVHAGRARAQWRQRPKCVDRWRAARRYPLAFPPLVIETKEPVTLPDRGCDPVDERRRYTRDRSQMCDRSDVVIQEQPHRKDVDIVVAVGGPLLKHSREHANPRLRHFGQVHS